MKWPHKLSLRPQVRTAPFCESLEGRQLLNGSGLAGAPHWDAIAAPATTDPAAVMPLSGLKDSGDHQFPSARAGLQVKGAAGHTLPALSAQAKADMQTLSSDISKLQSEVPATLQAQIKADKTTIKKALSSLTPQQFRAAFPAPTSNLTTPPDPTTVLTTKLKAANVPDTTINSIISDFKTYEQTLKTIDPTLSAKIQADQTALTKDMPAPAGQSTDHPGPMPGAPGLLMRHGPGF